VLKISGLHYIVALQKNWGWTHQTVQKRASLRRLSVNQRTRDHQLHDMALHHILVRRDVQTVQSVYWSLRLDLYSVSKVVLEAFCLGQTVRHRYYYC
jgi:hypothetical protein